LDCAASLLASLDVEKAVVDDKLIPRLNILDNVVPESRATRSTHYRILVTLADNLANYARVMLEENPAKAVQAIKQLEK